MKDGSGKEKTMEQSMTDFLKSKCRHNWTNTQIIFIV